MYKGKLIRLRAFESGDLDANHAFMNDYATLRGMISGIPFPSSYQDEQQWLQQQTGFTRGEFQFAIEDFEGNLAGRCGVIRLDWKNRVAELAIMVGTPYRGRGYGKEAMALLCDFCFREMNLHRLKVSVFAFNRPAIRCYEANGFVREGLLRQEVFRDGEYRDVVVMGRLADDPADSTRAADRPESARHDGINTIEKE